MSHPRRTVGHVSAAEAAFEFLRSSDGRAMTTRALQRRGLPLGLRDDLVAEVLRRVVGAEAREPIDNPAGFATTAAQYAAADLLRGELRRPLPLLPTAGETDDLELDVAAVESVDDEVLAAVARRDLREALFDDAVSEPSRVATALAYLAARVDDAPVGPRCPRPVGGAGAQEAAEWAGLWYGGRRDCFPQERGPDSAALRKRRSRAVAHLHALLRAAAVRAEIVEDDDA